MDFDTLIPLAEYEPPSLPTQERMQALVAKLKAMFLARNNTDIIANERVSLESLQRLDEMIQEPEYEPQVGELDEAAEQWFSRPAARGAVLAVITPPCDQSDSFSNWARGAGHLCIAPPVSRSEPVDWARLEASTSDKIVIVPQLEQWFLRSAEGLDRIRKLVVVLGGARHAMVGCNSFAWAYLSKAVRIDLVAPGPFTFKPMDGERLATWLAQVSQSDPVTETTFRLIGSETALLRDRTDPGVQKFFATLAGRSLGIPSVAWHMWRDTLRIDGADGMTTGSQGAHSQQRANYWVASLEELILPGTYPRELLFALHTLCLHGGMSGADLADNLPESPGAALIPALRGSQFVQEVDGILRIRPEAYPAIRNGLRSSGFPIGAV